MKSIKIGEMIRNTIIFTTFLILVLIAYLYFTKDYDSSIGQTLLEEIIFAFIVASISTFLFEILVKGKLIDEILSVLKVDKDMIGINIVKIYKNRSDEDFKNDLIQSLNKTNNGKIYLLGVALIDFFDDDYSHKENIQKQLRDAFFACVSKKSVNVKVLFANPYNKRTFGYRYIFEESQDFKDYRDEKKEITRPMIDALLDKAFEHSNIKKTIESMIKRGLEQYRDKIAAPATDKSRIGKIAQALKRPRNKSASEGVNEENEPGMCIRLYNPHPLCFMIMINNTMFIEPYTFAGKGGKNIVIQVKKPSDLFNFYEKHFKCLWYVSNYCSIKSVEDMEALEKSYTEEEVLIRSLSKYINEKEFYEKMSNVMKALGILRDLNVLETEHKELSEKREKEQISKADLEKVSRQKAIKAGELKKMVDAMTAEQKNVYESLIKMNNTK